MSKISTYEVVPVPKLADKLIGTSVGGEIEDVTYNFTLQELLDLFLPVIPANNLQGVLDYGNTATQDINLFGTITTTNLDVTDTANLYITYLNEETHIVGSVFDSEDSAGTEGQVLTSTEDGVAWVTLPPIFTPNLQQVLEVGNTSTTGIILDAGLEALDVDTDTATINTNITFDGTITDGNAAVGGVGQVLSSTGTGVEWVSLPVYTATSPLFLNPATNVISIQKATSTQNGYLSSSDWITFDGKQNAGNYITALTGEATASGPGAASVTLGNAAVIGKVLTGFNPTAGTINASDSILTAFGKTQSQINALVGGVQYKGTWNASTNVPTLQSSVGVQGNYYIVNVAGTTNLNGITDWQVGDWAIFSESTWQKVDNTESVVSVNGFTGAVSLTTDNIPEGTTNLYYLDSRARGALSFAAGSGAYNNVSGVITIPTDNSQILNGAGYITLGSLSANAPLTYNPLTGVFSIPKATTSVDGYLSATDWTTFNNKQNYLGGTGLVKSTAGTITYITDNSGNWNTAYDRSIVSAAVTGTTTKTLTLNEQDGNTITASWTDLDTGLTSVGVSMPSAFSVANSPLTANGTIAITGAGTSLQYIDGTGALQTFPGLTGFVPYTGATTNVNLGEYGISAGYFQADLTPSGTLQVGRMQWNATDGTMDLRLMGNNVTLQIGEENVTRVVNKSGIDLLEADYQVVRIRKVAEGGAQGQRLAVVLAQGNNENNSTEVLGLVTETINVNQEGFVTNFGEVKQINTTGSLQGETWVDGNILYLSATIPGQLTNIRPVAPNHAVIVGYVTYAHANNGKIYVAVDTGYELGELHNVYAPSPADKASIWWNASTLRYENNTVAGILGYTPANAATELTINGTTYDLSANRSWSVGTVTSVAALTLGTSGTDLNSSVANGSTTPVITLNVPTASAANRGALSAADWSTFNTKVGSVTASSPLASSGGSTPNITIQQASGSQDGYLSSTDWTTFNNKQAAGNYITSLTGEATASGPGAASVTLNNASVTAKVLTGINITGGTVQATDTMLTAFGKLQNQINGLVGGSIYQGTWNASTNTPALASGVGTKGYYYIVSVAGNTNLDGITDWFVGDWAIFDGTAWQQVDNTDAVVSVNGQTGAVSLTTDNIPEGATNLYFTDARSRASLSFAAGSGAYNSTSGLITIPTNTNQLTNGASFITLASLSGSSPIQYNNTSGAISITQAGTASDGYLSSTDWNTFNNKAPSVVGGYLPLTAGSTKPLTGPLYITGNSQTFIISSQALGFDIASSGNFAPHYITDFTIYQGAPGAGVAKMTMLNTGATTFASTVTASSIIKTGGTSSQYLMADGSTSTLTNPITGTGTADYLAKFTTASTIAVSNLYESGYKIYLGTTTANSVATSSFTVNGGSQAYVLYNSGITGFLYGSSVAAGIALAATYDIRFETGNAAGTSWDERGRIFRLTGNFKLGYGSSPTDSGYKLDVNGTARFASYVATDGNLFYANTPTLASYVGMEYQYSNTTYAYTKASASDGELRLYIGPSAGWGGTMTFYTDNVERGRFTNGGNLLIGTTTNAYRLTVKGLALDYYVARFIGGAASATNVDLFIGDGGASFGTRTNHSFALFTNDTDRFTITTTGQAGIKVTPTSGWGSVMASLQIGSSGSMFNYTGNNNNFTIGANMYDDGAGNQRRINASTVSAIGFDGGAIYFKNAITGTAASVISWITNLTIASSGAATFAGSVTTGDNLAVNGVLLVNRGKSGSGVESLDALQLRNVGTGAIGDSINIKFVNTGGTQIANIAGILGPDNVAYGSLAFMTRNYFTDSMVEMMRITNRSNILINTTTGVTGGGTLQVNGNVNINGAFQVNGVTIGGGGGSGVTGSGTTNYIPKWSSSSSLSNSLISDSGSIVTLSNGSLDEVPLRIVTSTANSRIGFGTNGSGTTYNVSVGGYTGNYLGFWTVDTIRGYFHSNGTLYLNYGLTMSAGTTMSFAGDTRYGVAKIYNASVGDMFGMEQVGSTQIGYTAAATRIFAANSSGNFISLGWYTTSTAFTDALKITIVSGVATFISSVTATGFFESSDSRLKQLIKDNHRVLGIETIKPKLYIKDGKEELGYFAQDVQPILSTAISVNDKGFLNLSYTQVHTAKIASLEERVSELESKLLKYES